MYKVWCIIDNQIKRTNLRQTLTISNFLILLHFLVQNLILFFLNPKYNTQPSPFSNFLSPFVAISSFLAYITKLIEPPCPLRGLGKGGGRLPRWRSVKGERCKFLAISFLTPFLFLPPSFSPLPSQPMKCQHTTAKLKFIFNWKFNFIRVCEAKGGSGVSERNSCGQGKIKI